MKGMVTASSGRLSLPDVRGAIGAHDRLSFDDRLSFNDHLSFDDRLSSNDRLSYYMQDVIFENFQREKIMVEKKSTM